MLNNLGRVLLVSCLVCLVAASAAGEGPVIKVHGPVVIAFFDTQGGRGFDTEVVLDDFQFYAAQVREKLKKAGVSFEQVYSRDFRVEVGKKRRTFRAVKMVGYFFAAPGKKPLIEYGVMTDADLMQLVRDHFGIGPAE